MLERGTKIFMPFEIPLYRVKITGTLSEELNVFLGPSSA
jgi:hypothetical protein